MDEYLSKHKIISAIKICTDIFNKIGTNFSINYKQKFKNYQKDYVTL